MKEDLLVNTEKSNDSVHPYHRPGFTYAINDIFEDQQPNTEAHHKNDLKDEEQLEEEQDKPSLNKKFEKYTHVLWKKSDANKNVVFMTFAVNLIGFIMQFAYGKAVPTIRMGLVLPFLLSLTQLHR